MEAEVKEAIVLLKNLEYQSEAWNLFVHPTDKKLQKNEIIFKLINEFGVW
ncbi:hypothetical protein QP391_08540 [Lactobacillus paragasseri]|nr:hypothetical protein [Lactobacillus paragasseri]MDK7121296.1 hypothetical protein [Lactobacillus paragasseri]